LKHISDEIKRQKRIREERERKRERERERKREIKREISGIFYKYF